MDTNFDELLGLVGDLGEKLQRSARSEAIFQALQLGEISEEQAVGELLKLLHAEGLLSDVLQRSQDLLKVMDSNLESMLPIIPDGSTGEQVVNPLWAAALAERVSLDGDVPELRHGPLPPEGKPAVPVFLEGVTDPVVVGIMLEGASKEVHARLLSDAEDHKALCLKTLALTEKRARETGADLNLALEVARKVLPEPPTGIQGYVAGEKPGLYQIPAPEGSQILAISDQEAQYYSHLALSTTQGRTSLAHPILEVLLQKLRDAGLTVAKGEVKAPLARASWLVASYGAGDFSPRFNFVEAAILGMAENLSRELQEKSLLGREVLLEVVPYNGVSTRTFGWEARIGPKE